MNIPNLFNVNKNKKIEDTVLNDMEINRVLANSDIQILKHLCDKNEILNRHGIFCSMENEKFYSALTQCYAEISNYEAEKNILINAQNILEKHCGIVHLLEAYVTLCECFKELSGYCLAADKVATYFSSEQKLEELNTIKNSIIEMKDILLDMSEFNLSFQAMDFIEKGHNPSTYIESIRRCANALRLNSTWKNSESIHVDDVLANAMQRLYSDQFTRLSSIEKIIDDQLNCDFSEIKNQIHFLINIWSLVQKAALEGIPYTIPRISEKKEIRMISAYSITLITKETKTYVANNMFFDEEVPFYFVTGANGGGKTEYLRALGTNLILFLSGCPIFAQDALIYPFNSLSTHFPKDERSELGRLEDEINRANHILQNADSESVLLFNETFSGTSQEQGLSMLLKVADYMIQNGVFGLSVTHFCNIDKNKYATLCPEVIKMPDGSNRRTYHIVRETTDSESYAKDIIRKYKLDQESLQKRRGLINV